MRKLLAATLIVASIGGVASAGTFLGLGVGPAPAVDDDYDLVENGRALRLLGGYQFGRISAEASLTFHGLFYPRNGFEFSVRHLMAAGKYNHPLADKFEIFGKLGIVKSWYLPEGNETSTGTGLLVGAGAEYRFDLIAASTSVFVEYNFSGMTIESSVGEDTVKLRQWMLGATVGF